MGRNKLPMKRIENNTSRLVTFCKRRNGLIKKAYELSVLCDIDIALIMFSPSGRLNHFSCKRRTEDVLNRFVNLSDSDRGSVIQHREYLNSLLSKIRSENDLAIHIPWIFEPDPMTFTSLYDYESYEKLLYKTLDQVTQRKEYLLSNQPPAYHSSVLQVKKYNTINASYVRMIYKNSMGESSSKNEDLNCWPENVCDGTNRMDGQTHANMFTSSSPENTYEVTRNQLSDAIFDPLPKSTMNEEPHSIEGFQGSNQESLWHQSTDELLSSLMTHDVTFSVTKVPDL
ncbi:hypothetical protein Lser_V15G13902 [Lactuca serriola]